MKFLGYPRPEGSVGVRNHVLVIPGGYVANTICHLVAGTQTIVTADLGGGRTRADRETIARMLIGLALNANVAAVLVHGVAETGFAEVAAERLVEAIRVAGKPVELVDPAKEGGTMGAIAKGVAVARRLVYEASKIRREPVDIGKLVIAAKCGLSDSTSGIAGNPAVGYLFDRIVDSGGTALFGETTEVIGAEHILANRAANKEVARAILAMVERQEARAIAAGEDIRAVNPLPANVAAGITTLEEKSLGSITKSGHHPINGVLQYGERPPGPGLYFVDNWPTPLSELPGYAAAGANLIVFQLGGGTLPAGTVLDHYPTVVAPVIWATANSITYARCNDSIDYYSGTVIAGKERLAEAGERLLRTIVDIASGTVTRVEMLAPAYPVQAYLLDAAF